VFQLGVVFYEMATGALPWPATSAGDIARAIVDAQPQSPRALNPQIDAAVMGVIGRCLFKDPYRRHKDARAVVEDIAKTDPDSVKFASDVAAKTPAAAAIGEKKDVRNSILLLADVANFAELMKQSPEVATKAASRMQQLVGEAAYLFDGNILDPFGPRLIAELPSVESALEAARKAEFDVSEDQQGDDFVPVRMLLHAVGVGGWMFSRRGGEEREAQPAKAVAEVKAPRTIVIEPFAVEGAEPAMLERANAIRLAAIEVLRAIPTLKVADTPTSDAALFGAKLRAGASGPEIVPMTNGTSTAAGPATPLPDTASGVQSVVQWVAAQAHVQPRTTNAESMNAFADALAARANGDNARTESFLRAAIKADPTFLPAQEMAMQFFESRGNEKDALEAAKHVAALAPENFDASLRVARGTLKNGDVAAALNAYASVLRHDANDVEAINAIGRYAVGVSDAAKFNAALARAGRISGDKVAIHAPDLLVASGKMETAIDQYYDIEVKTPNNPALALKIGRIAVLRRSAPIADLELNKLAKLDPDYGYHLLNAYIAAGQNSKPGAEAELKAALAASKPGDEYYTSAAEIYAMFADNKNVISSLEKVAERREPT